MQDLFIIQTVWQAPISHPDVSMSSYAFSSYDQPRLIPRDGSFSNLTFDCITDYIFDFSFAFVLIFAVDAMVDFIFNVALTFVFGFIFELHSQSHYRFSFWIFLSRIRSQFILGFILGFILDFILDLVLGFHSRPRFQLIFRQPSGAVCNVPPRARWR